MSPKIEKTIADIVNEDDKSIEEKCEGLTIEIINDAERHALSLQEQLVEMQKTILNNQEEYMRDIERRQEEFALREDDLIKSIKALLDEARAKKLSPIWIVAGSVIALNILVIALFLLKG